MRNVLLQNSNAISVGVKPTIKSGLDMIRTFRSWRKFLRYNWLGLLGVEGFSI